MSTHSQARASSLFTPVLIGGCIILLINFALRASFGVFQIPIAAEFNWPRSEFSLAIAIQNLAWGIGQPIFGALGERWGDRWSIIIGASPREGSSSSSSVGRTSSARAMASCCCSPPDSRPA